MRGAGFIPGHVEDAVKVLLAEAPPPGLEVPAAAGGGLEADYFFAGDKRPGAFKAAEGKPMPALEGSEWTGSAAAPADLSGRVVVLHFMSSGNLVSLRQAAALAALEKEIGPQGVVVVAICPPDDDWEALRALAAEGKLPTRVFRDARKPLEPDAGPDATAAAAMGATAARLGIRYAPATLVIDRSGVVRGAGVKPDKVKQLAGVLLAEAVEPARETPAEAPTTGG